jgi:hypothetical protein
VPDRHDRTGGERRYGVKIAPQDGRHIAGEDIARHSAADARQHAHDRDHQGINTVIYRLLRADDREQAEANRVEEQYLMLQRSDLWIRIEGHQAASDCDEKIMNFADRRWRHGADQNVA